MFKVNVTGRPRHLVKGTSDCYIGAVFIACPRADYYPRTSGGIVRPLKEKGFDTLNQKQCSSLNCLPPGRRQESNYELFNRNNFNIRYWSWNYRGCWHQTCPPIDTHKGIYVLFIPITKHGCPVLLFLVTTSLYQDWVICAPAAFLGCGSRFSGSLSGIEPRFPVTRCNHGRRITYHRKLIRQTFERCVAGSKAVRSAKVIQSHHSGREI